VLLEWAISYFTYSRGARLITYDRPVHLPAGPATAGAGSAMEIGIR